MERSVPEKDWDDLDIFDRESAQIRNALKNIELRQWVRDLHDLDPQLFERLKSEINAVPIDYKFR